MHRGPMHRGPMHRGLLETGADRRGRGTRRHGHRGATGPPAAIERFGGVRVLAEIPPLPRVDAEAVDALARDIAPLADCLAALDGAPAEAG